MKVCGDSARLGLNLGCTCNPNYSPLHGLYLLALRYLLLSCRYFSFTVSSQFTAFARLKGYLRALDSFLGLLGVFW